MIKVNLLPPEYRKVEGTPVGRLVAIVAGVVLTATTASGWGYVHLGKLAEVRSQRQQMEEELVGLNALAQRSQALLAEFKEYQRRRQTIESVGKSRILWSQKLDQLADLIHNKGDTKKHLVWLSSVRTAGAGAGTGGQLMIQGWSGGDELARLSDFNKDLKANEEFFQDFLHIDPPRGERVAFDDDRYPTSAWRFAKGMTLKPPGWKDAQ